MPPRKRSLRQPYKPVHLATPAGSNAVSSLSTEIRSVRSMARAKDASRRVTRDMALPDERALSGRAGRQLPWLHGPVVRAGLRVARPSTRQDQRPTPPARFYPFWSESGSCWPSDSRGSGASPDPVGRLWAGMCGVEAGRWPACQWNGRNSPAIRPAGDGHELKSRSQPGPRSPQGTGNRGTGRALPLCPRATAAK
jgi:hypothetical protein